jgi:hypothetical protein
MCAVAVRAAGSEVTGMFAAGVEVTGMSAAGSEVTGMSAASVEVTGMSAAGVEVTSAVVEPSQGMREPANGKGEHHIGRTEEECRPVKNIERVHRSCLRRFTKRIVQDSTDALKRGFRKCRRC